jgi:hypothetical protein
MAWADRLWVATYVSHGSRSGGRRSSEIDDTNMVEHPGELHRYHTNRYVHFFQPAIIGPGLSMLTAGWMPSPRSACADL